MATPTLHGNYPILATAWNAAGGFDPSSQARLINWLIDSGVHGLVLGANASEGHAQSDAEKREIIEFNLREVRDRIPVIVTVSHFAAEIAAESARLAAGAGASCVMSLPPFFGNWGADAGGVFRHFEAISGAASIPIMVQDHPVSGVAMSADFLARLATQIENVAYFKIEFTHSPHKIAHVLKLGGDAVRGIFGGTSGVYLLDEYPRGARGVMPACYLPAVFSKVYQLLSSGLFDKAYGEFISYLPLLNFELRMANQCLWKSVLKELGVIDCDWIRGPIPAYWDEGTRSQLLYHVAQANPATFGAPMG